MKKIYYKIILLFIVSASTFAATTFITIFTSILIFGSQSTSDFLNDILYSQLTFWMIYLFSLFVAEIFVGVIRYLISNEYKDEQ